MKALSSYLIRRSNTCLFIFICFIFPVKGLWAQTVVTVAGTGYHGTTGDGGPATCAGVSYPYNVAVDAAGNLYITTGNAVRKVSAVGGIITTVAGNGNYGYSGDGGPAVGASLKFPYGVCVDGAGNLYIADGYNHCIRKVNTAGNITTIAGNGGAGFAGDGGAAVNALLHNPQGICIDGTGNLYIADFQNSRIRKIDAVTGIITTIGGTGATTSSGDGGPAVNAGIPYPVSVCVDAAGNIYESEVNSSNTSRVRKISAGTGIINTVAGTSTYGYSGDGGPATMANLFDPAGICVDAAGNLYIDEYDDSRIRKVDAATGIITTIAGTGVNGFSGDNGPALSASFDSPVGICIDAAGNLFVTDNQNQRVRKIYLHGAPPPPTTGNAAVSISSSGSTICTGQTANFTAVVSNGGASYTFQWKQNGNPVGGNVPQYSSSTLANGDIITCQIIIAGTGCSPGGTVTSNAITMTVSPTPAPTLQIVASVNKICAGDPVIFTANAQNAGLTPSYEWKLNGNAVGSGAANYENDNLASGDKVSCILIPGQVSCPITGDIQSNTLIIPVNPLPVVVFNPAAISIGVGQRAQLHAVISGSAGTYQWSPASGLVDIASLDPFTVPLTSTTTYQLRATSGEGCNAVQDIVVKVLSKFNMPNSFTPNGDGRNDLFRIPPATYFNLEEFSIFDRWGNLVFSTRDRSQGWDGRYKGQPSPSGTYVYFISGSEGGKTEVIKGTVQLVR